MNEIFEKAFAYAMNDESDKFVNDPRDSGGPTKYGITQRAYEDFVKRRVGIDEIKNMTVETAKGFYLGTFWQWLSCDKMTQPAIAICIFDTAILYGPGTTSVLAQKALSVCGASLKFDGILGDKSISVLNVVKPEDFLKAFYGLTLSRIDSVIAASPKDEAYRDGWTNRAGRLLTLIT